MGEDRRKKHPDSRYRTIRRLVWLSAICGVCCLGALAYSFVAVHKEINDRVRDVQESRHFSAKLSCAVQSAIAEAGRKVLLQSATPSSNGGFVQALEKLGYKPPTLKQRQRLAAAYVLSISESVDKVVGSELAKGLIRKDGSIDCQKWAGFTTDLDGRK